MSVECKHGVNRINVCVECVREKFGGESSLAATAGYDLDYGGRTQATVLLSGAIVQAPIPDQTPADVAREAEHLSIVMAYEAMRICLGQPTKYHTPDAVLRWMKLMAEGQCHNDIGVKKHVIL